MNTESRGSPLPVRGLFWIAACLLGLAHAGPLSAAIIYVDQASVGLFSDGTQTNPFTAISQGLAAAGNGDIVDVALGTYHETVIMKSGVSLRGAGADLTIIDASGLNNSAVTFVDVKFNPRLSGVRITGGDGELISEAGDGFRAGGGILMIASAPVIRDCVIDNNVVDEGFARGGGIYIDNLLGDVPQVIDNVISNNVARSAEQPGEGRGGGIYVASKGSTIVLSGNVLDSNVADIGGGIYLNNTGGSLGNIQRNIFRFNEALEGAAIFDQEFDGSVSNIVNNLIIGNGTNAGVVDCDNTNPLISPNLPEACNDGLDNDCNPATLDLFDNDNDGFFCNVDCDDNNPAVNGSVPENCVDGIDNDCDGLGDVVQVVVEAGSPMKYIANSLDPGLAATWVNPLFNDATWLIGTYGIGFELAPPGATALLQTVVPTTVLSVYTRFEFNVLDVTQVNNLLTNADYDDGWVMWINGVEVHRSPEMGLLIPNWNTKPFPEHESSNGAVPDYGTLIDISSVGVPALVNGTNVVAIGGWTENTSSDLVLVPKITMSIGASADPDCNLCVDTDGDGYSCTDCNEADPNVNPGMFEICNDGIDNDCNPGTDDFGDFDGDGFICTSDCDETNPLVNPGAAELACDGIDNDCNAGTPDIVDEDQDFFLCDVDCNDNSPSINPNSFEFCFDGIDNNCDGFIDIEDAECGCDNPVDIDGDGFRCRDCNDFDPDINPSVLETCGDGVDNDCSDATPDIFDIDGDLVTCDLDCAPTDPAINPLAFEICNDGLDNDCDTLTDLLDVGDCGCPDADNDGYACTDCNDANPAVNPGAVEICNDAIDNDCNVLTIDLFDNDLDGFTCINDCRDGNINVNPGAAEHCGDRVDNDCDGLIDFIDPLNPLTDLVIFTSTMIYLPNLADPGIGLDWTLPIFATSGWFSGIFGVGYEVSVPGANNLIPTTVPIGTQSIYTRTAFFIADVAGVNQLLLGFDYDDGVVAWINGVEVFRSPEMPPGPVAWNTEPALHESSNGKVPQYGLPIDVSLVGIPALQQGINVLAIGVYNEIPDQQPAVSSDLVLAPLFQMQYGSNDPDCACPDLDRDGYACTDCQDLVSTINPGRLESPCDLIDNDCNIATPDIFDVDGDTFACNVDCVDFDPLDFPDSASINPGALEVSCDFIDNDCNPGTPDQVDVDLDGFICDCNELDNSVFPGQLEILCDGIDNDCNTQTADLADQDFDGFLCGEDCEDLMPDVNPAGIEKCNDGIDNDCDGALDLADTDCLCPDVDLDGYACGDCNDAVATINPGTPEVCNDGVDNDCNPATLDVGDTDGDGVDCLLDCDESNPFIRPGVPELCGDGIDNDCDVLTPDIFDGDLDTFLCNVDCDDTNPLINPVAVEVCNDGLDNDCNPLTIDVFDVDLDTFDCTFDCDDTNFARNPGQVEFCNNGIDDDCNPTTPDLFDADGDGSICDLDCNDADPAVFPGAPEHCGDGIDNDCDLATDMADTDCLSCLDADGDGFACDDCNDSNPNVNPNATEVCNDLIDNDCNPATADVGDLDGDGFACDVDCNDNDPLISPGSPEVCSDAIDNDCNPLTVDLFDLDGDGVICRLDCDETNVNVNPLMPEITCDGIDNDCKPQTSDIADADGDSVGCVDSSIRGGAISSAVIGTSQVKIINNTLVGNTLPVGTGGAIWIDDMLSTGSSVVANNIFAENSSLVGGAIDATSFFGAIVNNAFHNNSVDIYDAGGSGASASANVVVDPVFISPASGNYRLRFDSPLIDSADPTLAPITDLEGFARPFDGDDDTIPVADVGAYEFPSGEVRGVAFIAGKLLIWDFSSGQSFNIYRGTLQRLRPQGIYTQNPTLLGVGTFCGVPGLAFDDLFTPDPGVGLFYLVTLDVGTFEGPLGFRSSGADRTNTRPCP